MVPADLEIYRARGVPIRLLILWRRLLIVIAGGAAAVASFIFLTDLARYTGWGSWAPLFPLSVDVVAAYALTQYRLTGDRTAAAVAWLAIAGSALGNAASHWYATGRYDAAVTIVGAVPAVSLGIIIHLATKGSRWSSTSSPPDAGSAAVPDPVPVPAPVPAAGPASPTASRSGTRKKATGTAPGASARGTRPTSSPKRSDADLLATIRSNGWEDRNGEDLARLLRIRRSRALDLRRALRSPQTPASSTSSPSRPDPPASSNGGSAGGAGTLVETR
jgi:hypothetical protein